MTIQQQYVIETEEFQMSFEIERDVRVYYRKDKFRHERILEDSGEIVKVWG